jgi:hypothetical protein
LYPLCFLNLHIKDKYKVELLPVNLSVLYYIYDLLWNSLTIVTCSINRILTKVPQPISLLSRLNPDSLQYHIVLVLVIIAL